MIRMWRAYDVRLMPDLSLGLTGSYKTAAVDAWKGGVLRANCATREESDPVVPEVEKPITAEDQFQGLVRNVYVGQMLKPIARDAKREVRFVDNKKFYEKRCEEHLLAGDHNCGIWGYANARSLTTHGYYLPDYWTYPNSATCGQWRTTSDRSPQIGVKALVSCIGYGATIHGERGYRVQFAEIERVYLPILPCGEAIAMNYGVRKSLIGSNPILDMVCHHPYEFRYDKDIPFDPRKVAAMLQEQFQVPVVAGTPWDIFDNVVKETDFSDD